MGASMSITKIETRIKPAKKVSKTIQLGNLGI
jgi:hypothetical protein